MLFNLIDIRHQRAILDRLAMTAIRLDIDGPSYRQHLAHQRAEPVESDHELTPA